MTSNLLSSSALDEETARAEIYGLLAQLFYQVPEPELLAQMRVAVTDAPVAAAFLAFAPGGLAEMSLIALSLNMSVVYVTLHHVARIVLAVTAAKIGSRWLR